MYYSHSIVHWKDVRLGRGTVSQSQRCCSLNTDQSVNSNLSASKISTGLLDDASFQVWKPLHRRAAMPVSNIRGGFSKPKGDRQEMEPQLHVERKVTLPAEDRMQSHILRVEAERDGALRNVREVQTALLDYRKHLAQTLQQKEQHEEELVMQMQTLKGENQALRDTCWRIEGSRGELDLRGLLSEAQRALERDQQEVDRARQTLEHEKGKCQQDGLTLQQNKEQLDVDKQRLNEVIQKLEREQKNLGCTRIDLETRWSKISEERKLLDADMTSLHQERMTLGALREDLNQKTANLETEKKYVEEERASLHKMRLQFHHQRLEQNEESSRCAEECRELEVGWKDLEKEREALARERARHNECWELGRELVTFAERNLSGTENFLAHFVHNMSLTGPQLTKLMSWLTEAHRKRTASVAELEERLSGLQSQNSELKQTVSSCHKELKACTALTEKGRQDMEEERKRHHAETSHLRGELSDARSQHQGTNASAQALQEMLAAVTAHGSLLEETQAKLRAQVSELERDVEHHPRLRVNDKSHTQTELADLQMQLKYRSQQLEQTNATIGKLQADITAARDEAERHHEAAKQSRKREEVSKNQAQQLQTEMEQLRERADKMELLDGGAKALQADMVACAKKTRMAEEDAEKARKEAQEALSMRDAAEEAMAEARETMNNAEEKSTDLNNQLRVSRGCANERGKELNCLSTVLRECQLELQQRSAQVIEMEVMVTNLQNTLEKTQKQVSELERDVEHHPRLRVNDKSHTQTELADLQMQLKYRSQQLEQTNATIGKLQADITAARDEAERHHEAAKQSRKREEVSNNQAQQLQTEMEQLRERADKMELLDGEAKALRADLVACAKKTRMAEEDAEKARKEAQEALSMRDAAEEAMAEARETINNAEEKSTALNNQLRVSRGCANEWGKELNCLSTVLRERQLELQQRSAQVIEMEVMVTNLQNTLEKTQKQVSLHIERLHKTESDLLDKCSELEKARNRNDELAHNLQVLEQEMLRGPNHAEQVHQKSTGERDQREFLQLECARLQTELEEMTRVCQEKEMCNRHLAEELEAKQAQICLLE
uniref:coiled-coil domain-containing protein 18-like isoform X2 n=1 Tax=Myxine glutinosa TaxID=7769 RepID=UPI00358E4F6F